MAKIVSATFQCGYIEDPIPGEDAINLVVTPSALIARNGSIDATVWLDLYKGQERIPTFGFGGFTSGASGTFIPGTTIRWAQMTDSSFTPQRVGFRLFGTLTEKYVLNGWACWETTDNQVPFSLPIVCINDGEPGPTGSPGPDRKPPRPRIWADIPAGSELQCGLCEDDDWSDIIIKEDASVDAKFRTWIVTSNFVRTAAMSFNSLEVQSHLRETSTYENVATWMLLTKYALIDNLGVKTIEMRDAQDNALFVAMDGDVTCNTGHFKSVELEEITCDKGTFTDVDVSGGITAETLDLKISTADHTGSYSVVPNGSIVLNPTRICLPDLPEGMVRTIKVLNTLESRSGQYDLVLNRASDTMRISKTLSVLDAVASQVTLTGLGANTNSYLELLGYNKDGVTYWLVAELKKYNQ